MGRPKKPMPKDLAEQVLEWIANGGALIEWCAQPDRPSARTVYKWKDENPEFRAEFARAREIGAAGFVEKTWRYADDSSKDWVVDAKGAKIPDRDHIQRDKLRVETLFKKAANFAPHLFGTKVQHSGDAAAPIKVEAKVDGPPMPVNAHLLVDIRKLAELAEEHLGEAEDDGGDT